jgi:hypothetical protein
MNFTYNQEVLGSNPGITTCNTYNHGARPWKWVLQHIVQDHQYIWIAKFFTEKIKGMGTK